MIRLGQNGPIAYLVHFRICLEKVRLRACLRVPLYFAREKELTSLIKIVKCRSRDCMLLATFLTRNFANAREFNL